MILQVINKYKRILIKFKSRIEKYFSKDNHKNIGIYLDDNGIYAIQVCFDERRDQLAVSFASCHKFKELSYAFGNNGNVDAIDPISMALEGLQSDLLKDGIDGSESILCINETDAYCYRKSFDNLDKKALRKEIEWDIELNNPYDGQYLVGWMQEDNEYLLGAVSRQLIEDEILSLKTAKVGIKHIVVSRSMIMEAYEPNTMEDLCYIPLCYQGFFLEPGMKFALFAALDGFSQLGLRFYSRHSFLPEWNWGRLCAVAICLTLGISAGVVSANLWQLHQLQSKVSVQKHQLELLADVVEAKDITDRLNNKLRQGENFMKNMGMDSWPCYSVLVHLGCNNQEGTWLVGVKSDNGNCLRLKGRSVSYNSLVKYIAFLEADKDFFPGGAVLEKSEIQQDGQVDFQIRVKL